ncbi:response regulator transcription factor [Paenibacillus eucommiae]|uniref:YesN/AraC family two-component response regulator n=1 Tax=Paenibacillus eucommiae TaxID=1355755 RepID=A0ABS4J9I6_9BACL|nr:response regulator [Paenibacillus eucommiae]MBP1996519.1 YesN/AraC family two-component response regulator [Paenibacillus eucommiae]
MYTLLLVDDEYEIRTGLCNYFPWDEIGFEVVGQAENGKQALDFVKNNEVDVILSDIEMPVMTGIELAEELQKQKSKIKIIFLSGHRNFEFAQKAVSYGVKSYVVKSTKSSELVNVFKKIKDELDQETGEIDLPSKELTEDSEEVYNFYDRLILTIKNHIKEHYKDVELEDISELVHMNPNYISRLFKKKTGQNFSDYLLSIRMEKALELLKDIKYKTYEVSYMLGYSNVKNFTRTFKSYYGKSPREFRINENLNGVE